MTEETPAKDRLVYAIIKFLTAEAAGPLSEESKESIEVARQCLETAYGIEHNSKPELDLGISLEEIVSSIPPARVRKPVTEEMKKEGEQLKTEGNEYMKVEKFQEAVDAYTKAIEIDNTNAIYFSNRAAAYNKLNRYYEAVDDCDEAISLDPNYSKAYGRKGLALSGLNQHTAAIENYKKAMELDPSNENFKTNLEIAEEKARTSTGPGLGAGLGSLLGGGGPGGMPDFASIMNNPAMMQMASQMMQTPGMQQMMSNMMAGMQAPPGAPAQDGPGETPAPGMPPGGMPPGGMENLLRAGQQFAEQMQRTNPELVDQLRNQFQGGNPPNPNNGSS